MYWFLVTLELNGKEHSLVVNSKDFRSVVKHIDNIHGEDTEIIQIRKIKRGE